MKEKNFTRLLWFGIALAIALWLTFAPGVQASERKGKSDPGVSVATTNSNSNANTNSNMNSATSTNVLTAGSASNSTTNTIQGSRAYAVSGGDMDINDCLATYGVGFGLWQGTHINALCEAERMNAQGNFLGAAKMKCSLSKFKRVFGRGQKCIDAVIVTGIFLIPAEQADHNLEEDAEYHEQIAEQKQIISIQQRELETVNERLETLEQRPPPKTAVSTAPGLSEQQRKEIEQVFKR